MLWKLRKVESILHWRVQNKFPDDMPSKPNLERTERSWSDPHTNEKFGKEP